MRRPGITRRAVFFNARCVLMIRQILAGSFLGLMLCGGETWGADANGNFAVDGVGSRSCQEFLDAVEASDEKLVAAYAG